MTFSSSMNEVIVTISVSGRSALIRPIAVMPSMFGISRSIRIDVRLEPAGHRHALGAVGGLADDLDVGLQVEEDPQAHADDGMVVHDEHADRGVGDRSRRLPARRRRGRAIDRVAGGVVESSKGRPPRRL